MRTTKNECSSREIQIELYNKEYLPIADITISPEEKYIGDTPQIFEEIKDFSKPNTVLKITTKIYTSNHAVIQIRNLNLIEFDDHILFSDYKDYLLIDSHIKIFYINRFKQNFISILQKNGKYDDIISHSDITIGSEFQILYKDIRSQDEVELDGDVWNICNPSSEWSETKKNCMISLLKKYDLRYKGRQITYDHYIFTFHLISFKHRINHKYFTITIKNQNDEKLEQNAPYKAIDGNQCIEGICKNSGTCSKVNNNKFSHVTCKCKIGYTGSFCEHKVYCGNCLNDECKEGGQCRACPHGWKGPHCTIKSCENFNMCQNGGQCIEKGGERECNCISGWGGDYCQKKICGNYICVKNSHCQVVKNIHYCICNDGWTGAICDRKICFKDEICSNHGKCEVEDDERICLCDPGWTGVQCAIKSCDYINMCGPHGECKMNKNERLCECNPGWTGTFCNEALCDDRTSCKNNGRCNVYKDNTRGCDCKIGWRGADCSVKTCEINDCSKNSFCRIIDNEISCECLEGWKGKTCTEITCDNYNRCGKNDGKNWKCECFLGWSGDYCSEISVQDLLSCKKKDCDITLNNDYEIDVAEDSHFHQNIYGRKHSLTLYIDPD